MKYRKKTVAIDAFQFDGTAECLKKNVSKDDWENFAVGYEGTEYGYSAIEFFNLNENLPKKELYEFRIHTLEGPHRLREDDYVIKGVHGEYYPCKPDIFHETYELESNGRLEPVKDLPMAFVISILLRDDYAVLANSLYESDRDSANKIISKTKEYMQDQLEAYAYLKTLNEE